MFCVTPHAMMWTGGAPMVPPQQKTRLFGPRNFRAWNKRTMGLQEFTEPFPNGGRCLGANGATPTKKHVFFVRAISARGISGQWVCRSLGVKNFTEPVANGGFCPSDFKMLYHDLYYSMSCVDRIH